MLGSGGGVGMDVFVGCHGVELEFYCEECCGGGDG